MTTDKTNTPQKGGPPPSPGLADAPARLGMGRKAVLIGIAMTLGVIVGGVGTTLVVMWLARPAPAPVAKNNTASPPSPAPPGPLNPAPAALPPAPSGPAGAVPPAAVPEKAKPVAQPPTTQPPIASPARPPSADVANGAVPKSVVEPSAPGPTPPAVGPAPTAALDRLVTDFVSLPEYSADPAGSENPLRIYPLSTLEDRGQVRRLTLHGIELANEHLKRALAAKSREITQASGNRLIAVSIYARDQTSDENELARFWASQGQLKFRWLKRLAESEAEDFRWVGICVLEVQFDGGSKFLAFSEPKTVVPSAAARETATSRSWSVVIQPSDEGKSTPVAACARLLGPGKIYLEGGDSFSFEQAGSETSAVRLPELAQRLKLESVSISLKPKIGQPGKWSLEIEAKPAMPADADAVAGAEEAAHTVTAAERTMLKELKKNLAAYEASINQDNPGMFYVAASQLALLLGKPPPANPPAAPMVSPLARSVSPSLVTSYQRRLATYVQQQNAAIYDPAKAEMTRLELEVKAAKVVKRVAKKDPDQEAERALARIQRVAVVLYREVDGVRVGDVVVGQP
jgi:hypothetical protein